MGFPEVHLVFDYVENLSPAQKLLLVASADCANELGQCWPSVSKLAVRSCQSRSSVKHHIWALEQLEILGVSERRQVDSMGEHIGDKSGVYEPFLGSHISNIGHLQPVPSPGALNSRLTRSDRRFGPLGLPVVTKLRPCLWWTNQQGVSAKRFAHVQCQCLHVEVPATFYAPRGRCNFQRGPQEVLNKCGVTKSTGTKPTGFGLAVATRGEKATFTIILYRHANELNGETTLVCIDELDHFRRFGSCSDAKKLRQLSTIRLYPETPGFLDTTWHFPQPGTQVNAQSLFHHNRPVGSTA